MGQGAEILDKGRELYGVEPEYLFAAYPDIAVLRHPLSRKWFAVVEPVSRQTMNAPGEGDIDVLNLKCHPMMVSALLQEPGFRPAYHMSKVHWISVLLDSGVDMEQILTLIDMSYDLVGPKKRWRPKDGE